MASIQKWSGAVVEACFKKIIPDDEPGAQNRVFLQRRWR